MLCDLDGTYAFFDGLCTHTSGRLAGGFLDDCIIECPKHNGRFDVRTGEAVRRPAVKPLGTYPVHVDGGRLVVALPVPEGPPGPAVLSSDVAVLEGATLLGQAQPSSPPQQWLDRSVLAHHHFGSFDDGGDGVTFAKP